jgi:hypothetical protein
MHTAAESPAAEAAPEAASTAVELGKELGEVHAIHAAHARRLAHPVLVLAHVVPLTPLRVREHRICFYDKLELFLVAALCAVR